MFFSLLPKSPLPACCALLKISVPQHPMNLALVGVPGDTREAKKTNSHSLKKNAWIAITEEGRKKNTLFDCVNLTPAVLPQN